MIVFYTEFAVFFNQITLQNPWFVGILLGISYIFKLKRTKFLIVTLVWLKGTEMVFLLTNFQLYLISQDL
jgi:hypothetical protein